MLQLHAEDVSVHFYCFTRPDQMAKPSLLTPLSLEKLYFFVSDCADHMVQKADTVAICWL